MIHKKYMDIQHLKPDFSDGFSENDHIIIQEKIDGANAAIRYDSETDKLVAQSRKHILDETNNLRGFYEYVQGLDKEKFKNALGINLILFCEWLVPHTVKYPPEAYNKVYCYDIYDTSKERYMNQYAVKAITETLNMIYVPIFYEGNFISWEHCQSFVGKTNLGGLYGEGIVIKNMSRLNDSENKMPFYVKLVGEKFEETKKTSKPKIQNPEILQKRQEELEQAGTIVTQARVEKILNKLVDENIIPENYSLSDMPIIVKYIGKLVYEDCIKEEPDTVMQIDNFGAAASKLAIIHAKNIIAERNKISD